MRDSEQHKAGSTQKCVLRLFLGAEPTIFAPLRGGFTVITLIALQGVTSGCCARSFGCCGLQASIRQNRETIQPTD
jgi:hypothetical protein